MDPDNSATISARKNENAARAINATSTYPWESGGIRSSHRQQTIGLQKYQNGNQNPKSTGDRRRYLCLTDMFGGHCNRILTLARGKRRATELGLSFALTNQKERAWMVQESACSESACHHPSRRAPESDLREKYNIDKCILQQFQN
jgi:hypothetical protein